MEEKNHGRGAMDDGGLEEHAAIAPEAMQATLSKVATTAVKR